jgi:hypothetical protein
MKDLIKYFANSQQLAIGRPIRAASQAAKNSFWSGSLGVEGNLGKMSLNKTEWPIGDARSFSAYTS